MEFRWKNESRSVAELYSCEHKFLALSADSAMIFLVSVTVESNREAAGAHRIFAGRDI